MHIYIPLLVPCLFPWIFNFSRDLLESPGEGSGAVYRRRDAGHGGEAGRQRHGPSDPSAARCVMETQRVTKW